MDLHGSINLLKLELTGIATIKGKKCLVIPIDENDIYVTTNEALQPIGAYLTFNVRERREASYGKTHYIKQSFSKSYRENYFDKIKDKPYLGDMKPLVYQTEQQTARPRQEDYSQSDYSPNEGDDELPF